MEIDDDRPAYTIFFLSFIHILLYKNISRSPSRGMEEKSVQQIDYFILKCHQLHVYVLYSHLIHMHDRMKGKYWCTNLSDQQTWFPSLLLCFKFSRRLLRFEWINYCFNGKNNPVRIIISFGCCKIESNRVEPKKREKKRFSFPFYVVDDDSHHRVPLLYQKIKANK